MDVMADRRTAPPRGIKMHLGVSASVKHFVQHIHMQKRADLLSSNFLSGSSLIS